ncbi:micrococcal nuclease [Parapedobacter luteus]|uniref:Micrococcal nuclease n=1 Tax=Parapedobacter luteus TaxID=623280 RepID=A0A1T5FII3_9SPHI|nr:micrococcal nuclease [Parapedobacter luteus]
MHDCFKQIQSYLIKKAPIFVALLLVVCAAFEIAEPAGQKQISAPKEKYVYVTKVIDGDTFWVRDGADEVKVRFIGIDAPETRNAGRKKKGHFGEEAKAYVTKLTLHKRVRLELDVQEKDRYQRLLAYVYLEDGTFLNAHLVAQGYAVMATYPPNIKYVDLFADLQQQARQAERGLWAEIF